MAPLKVCHTFDARLNMEFLLQETKLLAIHSGNKLNFQKFLNVNLCVCS